MNKTKLAFVVIIGIFCFACNEKEAAKVQNTVPETAEKSVGEAIPLAEVAEKYVVGTFTDSRNGKAYKTVKIGEQVWIAENLNYNASGSKCYNDSTANCGKYGRLYNWETAMKACPKDWHLPVNDEWEILLSNLGGKKLAEICVCSKEYEKMEKLKAKDGFAALLGGKFYRESDDEDGNEKNGTKTGYDLKDSHGGWLSASHGGDDESGEVWVFENDKIKSDYLYGEPDGWSVRCIQDTAK